MSLTVIAPFLIGWFAGLLINYLADVLPVTRSFSQPVCLRCNTQLSWRDYFLLRACPNGHPRGIRFWVFQAATTAASVYTWMSPPGKLGYFIGMIVLVYFGVVIAIDIEHRLILHPTSIFGAILGLTTGSISHGIPATLWGGLGGFLIMLACYYLGVLFSRIRSKRMSATGQEADEEEALGAGDVILSTVLGFMLGWPLIWFGLLLGIILGGIFSMVLVLWLVITRKYQENLMMVFIPYGPYLVSGALLIIFLPKFVQFFLPG